MASKSTWRGFKQQEDGDDFDLRLFLVTDDEQPDKEAAAEDRVEEMNQGILHFIDQNIVFDCGKQQF